MRLSLKSIWAVVLVVAVSTLAGAGSAVAGPYASWTTSGNMTLSGTNITLSKTGQVPVTCPSFQWTGVAYGSSFAMSSPNVASCSGGTSLTAYYMAFATSEPTNYALTFLPLTSNLMAGPWGHWLERVFTVPFANAAGGQPSRATFSNTYLGSGITMTGTLNATIDGSPAILN